MALLLFWRPAAADSGVLESIDARALVGSTLVTIRLSNDTSYTVGTLDPEGELPYRVYIDLEATRLGPATARETSLDTGPLVRIRTGQFTESAARVVLDFKEQAPFTVKAHRGPFRIVLSIGQPAAARARESRVVMHSDPTPEGRRDDAVRRPATVVSAKPAPAARAAPATDPAPAGVPRPSAAAAGRRPANYDPPTPTSAGDQGSHDVQDGLARRHPEPRPARFTRAALAPAPALPDSLRIVIDPGHGGRDPGARSVDGAWEKDIVLGLSRFLAKRARERLGVPVVLTRRADDTVSIRRRAAMARGASLLVSVHANVCPESWVEGVQTFYADHGRHVAESRRLARLVHHRVVGAVDADYGPVHDGGVWERSLGLLRLSPAPSLLIEAAYLSNPTDRRRLDDPDYQLAVIDGIVDGIADYLAGVPDPLRLLARR